MKYTSFMQIRNPTQRKDYKEKVENIREMRGRTKVGKDGVESDLRAVMARSKDS